MDPDQLSEQSRRYIKRYQPSSGKLQQYLATKCPDAAICAAVFSRVQGLLNDRAWALDRARRYQRRGRNAPYIRQHLQRAAFPPAIIADCLQALTAPDSGSLLDPAALSRRIAQLRKQGKSAKAICQQLGAGAADRALIQQVFAEQEAQHTEAQALQRVLSKLLRQHLEPRKIRQRLLSRGFRAQDIQAALARGSEQA